MEESTKSTILEVISEQQRMLVECEERMEQLHLEMAIIPKGEGEREREREKEREKGKIVFSRPSLFPF